MNSDIDNSTCTHWQPPLNQLYLLCILNEYSTYCMPAASTSVRLILPIARPYPPPIHSPTASSLAAPHRAAPRFWQLWRPRSLALPTPLRWAPQSSARLGKRCSANGACSPPTSPTNVVLSLASPVPVFPPDIDSSCTSIGVCLYVSVFNSPSLSVSSPLLVPLP